MSDKNENIKKNSFKELEEIQSKKYRKNTEKIGNRVKGSLGTIGLISEIIELYFSRLIDMFINLGSASKKTSTEEIEEEE